MREVRSICVDVICDTPWLRVELGEPHRVLSWAVVGGGLTETERVVWRQIRDDDLALNVDPISLLARLLAAQGWQDAVGLLTSCRVADFAAASSHGVQALATVGLSNRLAVGDPPGTGHPGTINLFVRVDTPLSTSALLEVLSIATEARTAAVLELGLLSVQSGKPATGTGTDCIVVACPVFGEILRVHAGKHTTIGSDVGHAVREAVGTAAETWLESQ